MLSFPLIRILFVSLLVMMGATLMVSKGLAATVADCHSQLDGFISQTCTTTSPDYNASQCQIYRDDLASCVASASDAPAGQLPGSGSSSASSGSASGAQNNPRVLANPLGTGDVRVVIGNVIKALLGIAGSLALLMFVWGGMQWIMSAGNSDRVQKGKSTFTWAVIGLAFIFLAFTFVNFVIRAFGA